MDTSTNSRATICLCHHVLEGARVVIKIIFARTSCWGGYFDNFHMPSLSHLLASTCRVKTLVAVLRRVFLDASPRSSQLIEGALRPDHERFRASYQRLDRVWWV